MSTSTYAFLADCLVAIHLAYIAYVIFGQLAILIGWPLRWQWIRNPWFRFTHLAMILIVAIEALAEFKCPLTTWEENLRQLSHQADASGNVHDLGFIAGILRNTLMFDNDWDPFLNGCYYGFAIAVIATLVLVPPRLRRPVPSR